MPNENMGYYPYPRYNNRNFGVQYVSGYDPTVDQQYMNIMQREYGKAMATNQALAAEEARQGEIFSNDPEGRQQVIDQFKGNTGQIKERYGHDLALAAPELARAVAKERTNPWYQKNQLHVKEFERRQKLLDQFGPNMIFTKDLPQGNLNNIDMNDIGFEYVNRLHLADNYKTQFGKLADKITDLGITVDPQDGNYKREGKRKGLTEAEVNKLVETEGKANIDNMIENMGISDTPENRAMLLEEFKTWSKSNLIGGEIYDRHIDPYKLEDYKAGVEAAAKGGVPPSSDFTATTKVKAVTEKSDKRALGAHVVSMGLNGGTTGANADISYLNTQLNKPENTAIKSTYEGLTNGFQDISIEGYSKENLNGVRMALLNTLVSGEASDEDYPVLTALENAGVIEKKSDKTYGKAKAYIFNGKTYMDFQLADTFKGISEEYKKLEKTYEKDFEALGELYEPSAYDVPAYTPLSNDSKIKAQDFAKSTIVADNSFGTLQKGGLTVTTKDGGKVLNDRKSEAKFNSWLKGAPGDYNVVAVPGTVANPPYIKIVGLKDDVEITLPLIKDARPFLEQEVFNNNTGEFANLTNQVDFVDSEINWIYGQLQRETKRNEIPLSELLGGGVEVDTPIVRKDDGHYVITIPGVVDATGNPVVIEGKSPAEVVGFFMKMYPNLGNKGKYYNQQTQKFAAPKANTDYSARAAAEYSNRNN